MKIAMLSDRGSGKDGEGRVGCGCMAAKADAMYDGEDGRGAVALAVKTIGATWWPHMAAEMVDMTDRMWIVAKTKDRQT